jgi:hypothetical protein
MDMVISDGDGYGMRRAMAMSFFESLLNLKT